MGARREDGPKVRNRVREARLAAGYTIQGFADAAGMSYRALQFIEDGTYAPGVGAALRIAAVLDVGVRALFELVDPDWRSHQVVPPGPGDDPGPVSDDMRAALVAAHQHPRGRLPGATSRDVAAALYAAGLAEPSRHGQPRRTTLAGRLWVSRNWKDGT